MGPWAEGLLQGATATRKKATQAKSEGPGSGCVLASQVCLLFSALRLGGGSWFGHFWAAALSLAGPLQVGLFLFEICGGNAGDGG